MDVKVGPSVGCLQSHKKCRLDLNSTTQIQQAKNMEKDDQEALAGLQLAAKGLDAWFCFVAASLVWSIVKRFAGQGSAESLPVGYIHLHTECSDLRVLPKLFWGRRRDASRAKGRKNKLRLYMLIAFVTFICVLSNLMGPATAVLVIPNLEWININNKSPETWFTSVLSPSPPRDASIAPSCSEDKLRAQEYSCTFKSYGATTDMIVAAAVATNDQTYKRDGEERIPFNALLLPPVLQEQNVTFTVNFSDSTAWIPNRQSLRKLSADLLDYDDTVRSLPGSSASRERYPDSEYFTRSLQSRLFQHGPILGQANLCFVAGGEGKDWKVFNVTENGKVRCYQQTDGHWWCIPVGKDWLQFSTASTAFGIQDFYRTNTTPGVSQQGQSSNGNITVSIDSATSSLNISNATFRSVVDGHNFNWSAAFANSSLPQNTTFQGASQIFEYKRNVPLLGSRNEPPFGTRQLKDFVYCISQTKLGIADYALNPSLLSNPIRLVETNVITDADSITPAPQSTPIHPDWTRAAWNIDGGNDFVGGRNGAARKTITAFEGWLVAFANKPETSNNVQAAQDFRNIHKFMGAQTVSLVPYTTSGTKPKDALSQPVLRRKAMIQIWKYDVKTPSSIFGFIIMLLGAILVVVRTILYTTDRENMKDATQILVSALAQVPRRKGHRRNASSTSSLQPSSTATLPEENLLDLDEEEDDEEEEEKKKAFPLIYVSPVTSPDLSGGAALGPPKRVPYKRRISFHG
ncbi:hypothetical protein FKW77_004347 [Venturia effusa]|uniref:Uncharacterized protein n=1 Tax=Venturia effusa TaxID=50376 RepID=A0A517LNS0_9PEZI|nr:hypothetical protein FKW77_004347 [Venturia effusa]